MKIVGERLAEALGGKAAVLNQLTEQGFEVPDFEVSPSDLEETVRRLGFPLAVRSSATVEDGRQLSFAGQFASFLNLRSLKDVRDAMDRCMRSVDAPSVHDYCERHDVDPAEIRMHVIVQRMIQPELAGVAFTVDPTSGEDRVVIEACQGLAEDLLTGRQSSLSVDHPLMRKYRPVIQSAADRVQKFFGCPQDIEFAIADDTLYILQARPVTRIDFAPQVGEWTNADFRDGGVSGGVCSPLMWSLYNFIWDRTLKQCLREIHLRGPDFVAGRMFFGRPYWNLGAVKQRIARIPGYVEREFDEDLGVRVNYEGKGRVTPMTLWNVLRISPMLFSVNRFIERQIKNAESFLQRGYGPIDRVGHCETEDIVLHFRSLIEGDYWRLESSYFRTIFALSLAKLDFKLSFPDVDYSAMVGGLPPLSHTRPHRTMRQMNQSDNVDVGRLVREFAHHCRFGIDVRNPRWDEDIEFVKKLVSRCCDDDESAKQGPCAEREFAEPEHADRRFRKGRGHRKLTRLRRLIWLREEMRDLSNRMYYHIRRAALKIADERFLGEDIFFMTVPQIISDDRCGIERARRTFDSYANYDAPGEIGHRYSAAEQTFASSDDCWQGIPAAGGQVAGVVWVARTVEEAMSAPAGAVLVCPFTEPGWTPVLGRVAAVVTETGGLLSHAAVICREYAIPAVLAVPQATSRISDGMRVSVDGTRGTVHRWPEA